MRSLILLAGPALLLAACGNDGQAENTNIADQSLSPESFSSNDVTAIDAVTGEASNMAADVNYMAELDIDADAGPATPGKATNTSSAAPRRPREKTSSGPTEPAEQPAANTSAAATANNAL